MKELNSSTAFMLCKEYKANSVSIGRKKINGKDTGKICVRFAVSKKIDKNQLNNKKLIPEKIKYNGKVYETDVEQQSPAEFLDCGFTPCFQYNEELDQWEQIDVSPEDTEQRTKFRPLRGGLSICNFDDDAFSTGTLGQLCIDERDNTIVGLTNAHVVIHDIRFNKDKELCYTPYNKRIAQPGIADDLREDNTYGGLNPYDLLGQPMSLREAYINEHNIGTVKRYWQLESDTDGQWQTRDSTDIFMNGRYNQIDAAIIAVTSEVIDNTSVASRSRALGINNISDNDLVPWATDAEMEQLIQDFENGVLIHVAKSGRTTGTTGFNYQNGNCPAVITDISGYIPVTYRAGRDNGILDNSETEDEDPVLCPFEDLFVFEYLPPIEHPVLPDMCPVGPLAGGDSGSVLVTNHFGGNVVIGHCFAGRSTQGVATRIDHVRNTLNVRGPTQQDVQSALTFTDYSQANYITASGMNVESSGYLMYNGKKYWQIGNAPPAGSV
jgi:hypothetical protein